MNETPPAAMPWYRSTVLRGVLTILVTQILSKVQAQYHIDSSVLGLNVTDMVSWLMDLISAGALAYMTHGRVTQKATPTITGTQSGADAINVLNPAGAPTNAPTTPPPPAAHPTG